MALPELSLERRRQLAEAIGINEQYLYQVVTGIRVPSPALARKINSADKSFELQDLRPDDWREIWPELAASAATPPAWDGVERRGVG